MYVHQLLSVADDAEAGEDCRVRVGLLERSFLNTVRTTITGYTPVASIAENNNAPDQGCKNS